MGNSSVLFDISIVISHGQFHCGNRGHAQSTGFPWVKSPFPWAKDLVEPQRMNTLAQILNSSVHSNVKTISSVTKLVIRILCTHQHIRNGLYEFTLIGEAIAKAG